MALIDVVPSAATVRRDAGLYGYERALNRVGLHPIAGVDEAGRGACAGPLVAGAVILREGRSGQIPGLADSKLLTAAARERCFEHIKRRAVAWAAVVISSTDCDRLGMHVANVQALRRAVARLEVRPEYALTDGFPVDGIGVPGLAVWKGDRVAACIAAASIVAKVTRDAIMTQLGDMFPEYDFATHKGYITPEHAHALQRHGPCPEHRRRFINVRRAGAWMQLDGSRSTTCADMESEQAGLALDEALSPIVSWEIGETDEKEDAWIASGDEVQDEC
jgi:ribonuclease HII